METSPCPCRDANAHGRETPLKLHCFCLRHVRNSFSTRRSRLAPRKNGNLFHLTWVNPCEIWSCWRAGRLVGGGTGEWSYRHNASRVKAIDYYLFVADSTQPKEWIHLFFKWAPASRTSIKQPVAQVTTHRESACQHARRMQHTGAVIAKLSKQIDEADGSANNGHLVRQLKLALAFEKVRLPHCGNQTHGHIKLRVAGFQVG